MSGVATGLLRHRVALQDQTETQNPVTGAMTIAWETIATPWAHVKPLSGREFRQSAATQSEIRCEIVMRYKGDVNTSMRILFRGKVYNIHAVIPDAESGLEHLTLLTSEGVNQGD